MEDDVFSESKRKYSGSYVEKIDRHFDKRRVKASGFSEAVLSFG